MADFLLGGQAVMEGVMMRAPGRMSVAVREPAGTIKIRVDQVPDLRDSYRILKMPVLRGVYVLASSLHLGFKALEFSAAAALGEEQSAEKPWYMIPVMACAIIGGICIFALAPLWLTALIARHWLFLQHNSLTFNLVEGVVRLSIFLAYLLVISLMPDIKRFFRYHGAEHQVIHTFENGEALTVEQARLKSPRHPRCGTSFLMTVVVVAILVFSLVPSSTPLAVKAASRLLLLPLVAGAAYEVLRFSASRKNRLLFLVLAAPGLWLQRITTAVPDDSILEVAIAALAPLVSSPPSGDSSPPISSAA